MFVYEIRRCGLAVTKSSDIAPVSTKEFLRIQAITECRFTINAYVKGLPDASPTAL